MIPLSSIPTYSASMDSSSFLKTSFNKFPYPTKAELCYLTVVTKFPEEQIKIWFTAQRLKQGISWSPEEIEEARRKMFNTIIQTAPSSSQSQPQSQCSPAPPTITVLPASLGASGLPHILQGSLVGQGGVIVAPPVIANGIQVSSAPVALAVTPKPQAAAHPIMQARPAAALVADKGVGMVVGTVGSSSTASTVVTSQSGQSGGGVISSQTSVINLSLSLSGPKAGGGKRGSGGADKSHSTASSHAANAEISRAGNVGVGKSDAKVIADGKTATDSDSNASFGKSSSEKAKDGEETDDHSSSSPHLEEADRSLTDSPRMDEPASPASKSSCPSPAAASSSTCGSRTPLSALLDPSFYKGKKSQEQLGALKDSFQLCQFPDQDEVERLIALTGLTVREVRKWFSDRRYHFRNLKGARAGSGAPGKTGNGSAGNEPIDTPQLNSSPVSPTPSQTPTSPTTPSRRLPRAPSPDFTAIRYKEREPHQVRQTDRQTDDSSSTQQGGQVGGIISDLVPPPFVCRFELWRPVLLRTANRRERRWRDCEPRPR